MKFKSDKKKTHPAIPIVTKRPETIAKASKVQEYVKKNFKSNRANTKSVYTRPR